MFEFGKALSDLVEKVGWQSVALILVGGGAMALSGSLPDTSFSLTKNFFLPGLALFCFSTGSLLVLVKILGGTLVARPGQGLIEGAAAGALASIVGGFLGFGFRPFFDDGFVTLEYPPRYIRILTLLVPAVPLAAVVGLLLDLLHPNIKSLKRLGAGHFALFSVMLLFLSIAVIHLNPVYFEEAGATYGDVQLVVVFVFYFMYIFYLIDFRPKPIFASLGVTVLVAFHAFSWILCRLIHVPHWWYEDASISLSERMVVTVNFSPNTDLVTRALDQYVLPETTATGFFVFLSLLWQSVGYWLALRIAKRLN